MVANPSHVGYHTRKLGPRVTDERSKHLEVFALVSVAFEKEGPFPLEKPNGDPIWESTVDTEVAICSRQYAGA
jgi:hypothetical protein